MLGVILDGGHIGVFKEEDKGGDRSPRWLSASAKPLGWMVTRVVRMAAKLASSKRETR